MARQLKCMRSLVWSGTVAMLLLASVAVPTALAGVRDFEVQEYRKDFDVSAAQAEAALDAQASAREADLVSQLEGQLGSRYAGIWFDNQKREFVVPLPAGVDEKAVAPEFARADLAARDFRLSAAESSWEELEAAHHEVDRQLLQEIREGYIQTSLDPRTNAVVITQVLGTQRDVRADARDVAGGSSVKVEIRDAGVNRFDGVSEACSDPFCDSPLRGGVKIYNPADPTRSCTAGFPATGANGSRYLITAGHCVELYPGAPLNLQWTTQDSALQPHAIGAAEQWEHGNNGDWAKIKADGSYWDTSPWPSEVAYWGGYDTNTQKKGSPINLDYPITGEAQSVTGTYACHSGIKTGTSCGYIGQLDISHKNGLIVSYHVNELLNACASPGDSGGPYFIGSSALGLHVDSQDHTVTCGDPLYYTDILRATAALGVSIGISPGTATPDEDDNTPGPRAITHPNGTVDVFFRTFNGNLGHHWYVPGSGWSTEIRPASIASSSVPRAVAQSNGTVDVFFRTSTGSLGHHWYVPGSGWSAETRSAAMASDPRVVAGTYNGTVDVFFRTTTGSLGHHWYVQGSGWSVETRSASMASEPHVVSRTNGTVDVFFRTTTGSLGHHWYVQGSGWSVETRSASMASDPHVVAQPNGTIDVFFRDTGGSLGHHWYVPGSGWSVETRPGPIASGTDPHLTSHTDGTIDVLYFTPTNQLGHDWYVPGKGWSHEERPTEQIPSSIRAAFVDAGNANTVSTWSLGASWEQVPFWGHQVAAGSSPETLTVNGVKHVFYVDATNNNTITDWAWNSSTGWQQTHLWGHSVAKGTSPSAVQLGNTIHVFYVDAANNNTITDWAWSSGAGWQQTPLWGHSVMAGSSPSAMMANGQLQVFFADAANGNTMTAWIWNPGSGWTAAPLWGQPLAAGTSPSAVMENTTTPHVFYVNAANNKTITDWTWNSSTGWQQTHFWGHSVMAGSSPSAIMANGQLQVFFADAANGNTVTAWIWNPGSGWVQTYLYGHPVAPGTSPSAAMNGSTPHVFFVDATNNKTITNWTWHPGTGWQQSFLWGHPVAPNSSPAPF